jgi:benzylsuccinate CoA-transferase BbsF subunit
MTRNAWATRTRGYAPHNTYRCLGDDDWIAVAARDDHEGEDLARAAAQGWEHDPRFADAASRLAHRAALDAAINAWTAGQEKYALMRVLMAAGVPAGAVLKGPELTADPHLAERGYFADLRHPVTGPQRFDGSPFVFNGERGYEHWCPTPMLGEHNHEILERVLGLPPAEVERLTEAAVLSTAPPY